MSTSRRDYIKRATCTMCFEETLRLKKVGPCRHSFCTECLSAHLGSQIPGTERFKCPTCRLECPLPLEGIEGLLDGTNISDIESEVTDPDSGVADEILDNEKIIDSVLPLDIFECRICHHRGVKEVATNRCEECDNLYLCNACSKIHNRKFSAAGHVLSNLQAETERDIDGGVCSSHNERLKNYCRSCCMPVCHVCIMLEHVEHDTAKIGELIRHEIAEIRRRISDGKRKLRDLDILQKEVMATKEAILEWKQTMLKRIDARTEQCMKEIVKQRDEMKDKIKAGFDVTDLSVNLLEIPEIRGTIQSAIWKAERLLGDTATHPIFVDKLFDMKDDLEIILETEIDEDSHKTRLNKPLPSFVPKDSKVELGHVTEGLFTSAAMMKGMTWFFKESDGKLISGAANLGNDFFAVAAPSSPFRRTDAVEIRHSSQTVKLLKDKVYPCVDMAATPSGQLAVLAYGAEHGKGSIRLFDPAKGFMRSIEGFALDIPVSLSVNIQGRYMVLDEDTEIGARLSVITDSGAIECRHPLREDSHGIRDIKRIASGGRYIYAMGNSAVAAYSYNHGKFEFKSTFTGHPWLHDLDDITATVTDDVYVTYRHRVGRRKEVFVARLLRNGGLPDWSFEPYLINEKAKEETRIDIRNNTLVLSDGHHYAVYLLK